MVDPIFNINDVILILTIGLSLILALFQPILPARGKSTRILLATFFLCLTFSDIGVLLIWNEYIPGNPTISVLVPYF